MGRATSRVSDVRVSGPLAPFAAGFRSRLADAGYTRLSTVTQMRLMAHLSRWLDANQLSPGELTDERIGEYLHARRAAGYTGLISPRGTAPLVDFLREVRVFPAAQPVAPGSAIDLVLASFRHYLLTERGLASSTAEAYVDRAGRFLAGCAPDGDLSRVTAGDVTRAVVGESAALSVGSAQYFVAALRSFLRFCQVEGLTAANLSASALAVTGRRGSSLPNGISPSDAQALLRSFDRRRAVGRRDYAIVMTLLRLGLRAGEVAALTLDDIDWRSGELVVHGKGRRDERLPLPVDLGEAIAGYLQWGRPKTARREVFLSAIAPLLGLSRGAVSSIVRRACVRADVTPVGAHRLRHTMACGMVSAGAPLSEIGQLLRHRSLISTAIYARVDLDQLRSLAQPWPAGADR